MLVLGDPLSLVANLREQTKPLIAEGNHALFDECTHRQDFPGSPHHDTKAIFLRWAPHWTPESIFDSTESIDYPGAKQLPAHYALAYRICHMIGATEWGRVMVVKMKPGGRIDQHWDGGAYAHHFDRFHLCLQGDEGNRFTCDGATVAMLPGELWWFNHQLPHSAHNDSPNERIHLIIDAQVQQYRARRLGEQSWQ